MHCVDIRRPSEDNEKLNQFFRIVISDTYAKEGIAERTDDIENEIETKKNTCKVISIAMGRIGIF